MKVNLSFEFANQNELIKEIEHLAEEGIIETLEDAKEYFLKHLILKTKMDKVEWE